MPRAYMCDILEISRLNAQCLQFLEFAVRMCRKCELIKSMESLSGLNNKRTHIQLTNSGISAQRGVFLSLIGS